MDLENIVVDITQRNYNTLQTIQYDVDSRYVNVKIVNNGKNVDLTNYMVSIACKKPDGKIVFNETEMVEPKQGLVKFLISEQISVALGEVVCELKIYGKNSSVLTTQYFTINVTQPIADKAIQSTNEFRQLTVAMNEYNAWISKVEEKYNELEEEYAEELSGVKSELEETNAQLSKNNNLINYVGERISNRNFKPKFGVNAYWGEATDLEGNTTNAELPKIESDIKSWEEHGCDEIVIPIHISYNQNNKRFYIAEELDDMLYAVNFCNRLNVKVTAIKVHLQRVTEAIVNTHGVIDFKNQYKSLLENIADKFANTSVEIMTVLNEVGWIYESDDYESFSNECLNIVKKHGYLAGVTCAGFSNFYNIKKSVINNSDKIFVNTYPRVSSKHRNTTLDDVLNGWKSNYEISHIRKIKNQYSDKPIVISECGVQDYWESLICPEHWDWQNLKKTDGESPGFYLKGLFETLNTAELESVWWWYDLKWDNTKKVANYYLKGVVNND